MTRFVNKSLVGIANRPVLSHVIEQFPKDVEFVIALGHKGNLVREFLELAYTDRRFFLVDVDPFEGPESGLGLSLMSCKQHLQEPFVFSSCDTLVQEDIPAPAENWMGFGERTELEAYRTVQLHAGQVSAICEKGAGETGRHKPYVGLAGIRDYERFWGAMEEGGEEAIQTGEVHGLRHLLGQNVRAHAFTWYDTGSMEGLARTREAFKELDAPNILEKPSEAIWFVAGHVIKFSDDEKFIADRVHRARELRGFVPVVSGVRPHMYRYDKVEGTILSEVVTVPLFERLLDLGKNFWVARTLASHERASFRAACMRFYREKTFERVGLFFETFALRDGTEVINGVPMPKLSSLLNAVDWERLADGIPGRFHGDFHFENILWSERDDRFTLLDWRQDFGGSLTTGDIYYDLAKLLHGLIISHELIARDRFRVEWGKDEILYDFHRKPVLVECEPHFHRWLESEGYDTRKVRILTALVFLNIAALHHYPYCLLLLSLGKAMLREEMEA